MKPETKQVVCPECGSKITAKLLISERESLDGYHGECQHGTCGYRYFEEINQKTGQRETKMKRILAIDLGTKTGWALNTFLDEPSSDNSDSVISCTENFRKRSGDSRGMIFVRFDVFINEIIKIHEPDIVVYERPHLRGRAASEVLNGMLAFLVKACEKAGIEYTDCPSTTLKKHATGKGNASKEKMMEAYREKWGEEPIDDNSADARFLLSWAEKEFG